MGIIWRSKEVKIEVHHWPNLFPFHVSPFPLFVSLLFFFWCVLGGGTGVETFDIYCCNNSEIFHAYFEIDIFGNGMMHKILISLLEEYMVKHWFMSYDRSWEREFLYPFPILSFTRVSKWYRLLFYLFLWPRESMAHVAIIFFGIWMPWFDDYCHFRKQGTMNMVNFEEASPVKDYRVHMFWMRT